MLGRMTKSRNGGKKIKGAKAKKQGKGTKKFDFDIEKKVSFNDEVEISAYIEESSVTTEESYSEDNNYDESSDEEVESPQVTMRSYVRKEQERDLSDSEDDETDDEEEEEEEVSIQPEDDEFSVEESLSSIEEVLSSDYEEETVSDTELEVAEEEEHIPVEEEAEKPLEEKPEEDEYPMLAHMYNHDSCKFRPEEYLGGSMPALLAKAPKKMKVRKSWLPNKHDDEADEETIEVTPKVPSGTIDPVKEKFNISYQSFFSAEAGGVTKSKVAKKKVTKSPKKVIPMMEFEEGTKSPKKTIAKVDSEDKPKRKEKPLEKPLKKPLEKPLETQKVDAVETSEKQKKTAKKGKASTIQPKKQSKKKTKETKGTKKASAVSDKATKNVSPKSKKVPVSTISVQKSCLEIEDPEERHKREREMQELRAKKATLRKRLHKIEIEKSSELTNLAEETTRRMREYLSKSKDVKRKKKAKMEKQTLKENTMKSQDLIDYLRNSNKKLREEGIRMARAVRELKEHNESIEEEISFRLDYLQECNAHHEREIAISTSIQNQLQIDLPNYEALVKELSESVDTRDRNGVVENRVKTLFSDALNKMVEMVEESCSNPDLVYTIVDIVNSTEDDVKQQSLNRRQSSSNVGSSISPGKREPPRSSSKVRTSFRSSNYSDVTKEPKRLSNSGNVKRKPSFGSLSGKELSFSDEETAATSLWDDSSSDISLENY